MPFYEYQCKNCGHELEAMQRVSDPPLKKCPHCGKAQLQRLISAPVFRLKGGGWYETDFKDDKDKKRNLADRPESESSKGSDTSESKPADAKVDTKVESKSEPVKSDSTLAKVPTAKASSSSSARKSSTARSKKRNQKSPGKSKRKR